MTTRYKEIYYIRLQGIMNPNNTAYCTYKPCYKCLKVQ